MSAQKTAARPPSLHIQRVKGKIVEELHSHDAVLSNVGRKNPTKEQNVNKGKQQRRIYKLDNQSLDQSIQMLDSPSDDQVEDFKKSISILGSGFKIMKVKCSNQDGKDKDGHGQRDVRKNKSFNAILPVQINQKNNPEIKQQTNKSKTILEDLPKLKNLRTISFKKQDIDQLLTEKDQVKEKSSKNPESITDSSPFKNDSSRRIIFSDASESPLLPNKEASSFFSAFLPINSNVEENHGSQRKLPFINLGSENNQNVSTPDAKFKKKAVPNIQQFSTKKKQGYQYQSVDSKTLYNNRVNNIQQLNEKVPDKQSQSKPQYDPMFNFLNILVTPAKLDQKEQLKGSRSQSTLKKLQKSGSKNYPVVEQKQSEQFMRLRNAMTNQKNLKLKDYLRLASLSNDSKFDHLAAKPIKNQMEVLNLRHSQTTTNLKKSFIFDKNRTAIDPEKSIALIKASLRRKLQKSVHSALKQLNQLGEDKQLLGQSYQDLVFICNINKIFDQNMFKTVDLLEDLLDSYKNKRLVGQLMEDEQKIEELKAKEKREIKQMFSPLKRGKKKPTETHQFSLIEKILKGLNIISSPEIRRDEVRQT